MAGFAPLIASREGAREAAGQYLPQVGDGVGLVTVSAENGRVALDRDAPRQPDVTIYLTADCYARLIAGRLDLASAIERGEVTVEGDRGRALDLMRIFQGI